MSGGVASSARCPLRWKAADLSWKNPTISLPLKSQLNIALPNVVITVLLWQNSWSHFSLRVHTVRQNWEGMAVGVWGSWSHCARRQEAERNEFWDSTSCPFFSFLFSPWNGAISRVGILSSANVSLKVFSQTCPVVGNSKPNQADREGNHTQGITVTSSLTDADPDRLQTTKWDSSGQDAFGVDHAVVFLDEESDWDSR